MKRPFETKSAQFILNEVREIAWLLSITAVLSIGGAGLGVGLAFVADAQFASAPPP